MNFLTNPHHFTRTPRTAARPQDYASAVTKFGPAGSPRGRWLDIATAVLLGLAVGVLLAWRG